ncbi:hypothetical protein DL93DRAFT_1324781 [Clavulina sp. PMI_390]|nr:hypothetical protein DL93DRAFT_1324781 [Clavulina sp. PMI_390]
MNKIGSLAPGHAKRLSASGAAGTALGGLASVGANGLVSGILEKIESLFGRDDLGLEARAPLSANGLGGSIISSAAGGAASGLVGNLLGLIEGLFRRDFADAHDEAMYMKRDVNSISNIIKQAQTLSASDKATVKTALMNKIGALQTPSKRLSASGAAGTALGGLASVGANGLVSGILEKIESLFRRDDFELEARAPLSANGLGGSIISSAAGGAASGLVGNLLGLIEGLFRRDLADVHDEAAYVKRDVNSISTIIQQAQTLSASDKAAVKTALMNKIGSLQTPSKRLSASGAAGTALGGLASVGANSLVSGLLEKLESLFRRDEEEALMAREELHGMERRSPLSASSFKPSGNGVTSQVLGGLAGGAASGLVGNLLSEFESLFQRSEEFSINELD